MLFSAFIFSAKRFKTWLSLSSALLVLMGCGPTSLPIEQPAAKAEFSQEHQSGRSEKEEKTEKRITCSESLYSDSSLVALWQFRKDLPLADASDNGNSLEILRGDIGFVKNADSKSSAHMSGDALLSTKSTSVVEQITSSVNGFTLDVQLKPSNTDRHILGCSEKGQVIALTGHKMKDGLVFILNGKDSEQIRLSGPFPKDLGWHRVTGVYDRVPQVAYLYIDGKLVDKATTGKIQLAATKGKFILGSYYTKTSVEFEGDMADVAIWSRPLSEKEVAGLGQSL